MAEEYGGKSRTRLASSGTSRGNYLHGEPVSMQLAHVCLASCLELPQFSPDTQSTTSKMPASSDVAGDQAAGNAFARFEL